MPDLVYEKMLQKCVKGELRVVNAGLPRRRKTLSSLLGEEYPHVLCCDGSAHLFKMKELEYLANITSIDEQEVLLLPILIALAEDPAEAVIICEHKVEEHVISEVLNMPMVTVGGKLRIYRPQLVLLRKVLKTTTQYVFSSKIVV